MSAPTVLVVQHVACEGPGLLAEVLRAEGLALRRVRLFRGDRLPRRLGRLAGLVLLGGPMGVDELDRYPFLAREIRLVEEAVHARRPVLGVCLGSQLLAAALGAPVTPGPGQELGWHPVTLSRAAACDPLWRGLPENFVAYHWHGDVFPLPSGAVRLAWSAATDCQAFRQGASAYGFLFHLEATERMIRRMARAFRRALHQAGLTERQVLEGIGQHLPPLHQIGRQVFQRWAKLARGETGLA